MVGLKKEVRRAGACMEGVEGRDGSRETDTPAGDVSVGLSLCVCEGCKGVPWKIAAT